MSNSGKALIISLFLLVTVMCGCKAAQEKTSGPASNSNATASSAKPDQEGVIHSGTGDEKQKSAAGKANVQGKVFYNEKPAPNIEVKLCETFNQYFGGCGGQTFSN